MNAQQTGYKLDQIIGRALQRVNETLENLEDGRISISEAQYEFRDALKVMGDCLRDHGLLGAVNGEDQ